MAYPQLYLGQVPTSAAERYVLRERALDLHAALRGGARSRSEAEPTYVLLHFAADMGMLPVEVLLLRPRAAIVAAVRDFPGPIEVTPAGRWTDLASGQAIRDASGATPLQAIRAHRDAVRARLQQAASGMLAAEDHQGDLFERMVGALICAPTTHPESRISLDIDDHRQLLKILGLDELASLAAMVRLDAVLPEELLRSIVGDVFGGRLWHDGDKLLFELAPGRFQLRVLGQSDAGEQVLPLIEGENIVGRRKNPRRYERRVTLSGDDLISTDHVRIVCGEGPQVQLRDISKNGTYLIGPDGSEERLHSAERAVAAGALLRIGVTRLRLERAEE